MTKYINDLETDLNEEIDISNSENNKAQVSKLKEISTNDLSDNLNQELNTKNESKIKLSKNKTSNFDSFNKWDDSKEVIDLVTPRKDFDYYSKNLKSFFSKHYKIIKLKSSKNTLNKKSIYKDEVLKSDFKIFTKRNFIRLWLFFILLSIVWLWTKMTIEKSVTSWYENILALKNDFKDANKAIKNIKKARNDFIIAKVLLTPISFIPNQNVKNVTHLVNWWYDLSKLLIESINIWNSIWTKLHNKKWVENLSLTELLWDIRTNYEYVYSLFYSSLTNFSKIWDLWDEKLNAKLKFVNEKLYVWLNILNIIYTNYDQVLSILWDKSTKKYLIVFQNNDEIRPTWGFMWSTATITISNWKITKVDNSDIYAYEWDINKVYTEKEPAPEWLNKITTTFWIRDANYYPLFKDSSQKIKHFLDMWNYEIDWIIYINQNIILDLLSKVWWVDSKILWTKIDDKNFSLILSTLVEAKVFKIWTLWSPKQVLFDFAWELYAKLIKEKKYYDYANILLKHIQNRDIVFYSFNPIENSLLWKLWLNWEINLNEKLDFNYPVYTSIGWNKTDRYKEYRYDIIVNKSPSWCDYVTKIDLYNSHMFSQFEDDKVNALLDKYWVKEKTDILNIQWRGTNKSYLRLMIPKNAEVYPEPGQNVIEYNNYKIVELYVATEKLQTSKNSVQYTIKNPECKPYSYKFFKQPWIMKYNINFDVMWEESKYTNITSDFVYKKEE